MGVGGRISKKKMGQTVQASNKNKNCAHKKMKYKAQEGWPVKAREFTMHTKGVGNVIAPDLKKTICIQ